MGKLIVLVLLVHEVCRVISYFTVTHCELFLLLLWHEAVICNWCLFVFYFRCLIFSCWIIYAFPLVFPCWYFLLHSFLSLWWRVRSSFLNLNCLVCCRLLVLMPMTSCNVFIRSYWYRHCWHLLTGNLRQKVITIFFLRIFYFLFWLFRHWKRW